MAVQAGENGTGWHHFTGLIPTMGVAQPRGIALTFLIQDGIQPESTSQLCQWAQFHDGLTIATDSLPISGDKILQFQQPVFTVLHHLVSVQMFH